MKRGTTQCTAKDAPAVEPASLARRRVLKIGAGAATTAVALPALSGSAAAHFPEQLEIDIKPDCEKNTINPTSDGVVPVAVLYTEFEGDDGNTVVFDPTKRDVRYRFGVPDAVDNGNGARPVHCGHAEDVDGDGHDDLVLHFPVAETGFDGDESKGKLRWLRHESGEHGYSGTDSVTTVGSEDTR